MRGVTKPVTLTVDVERLHEATAAAVRAAGFDVTGKLNRKDFGVNWNKIVDQSPMLSDDVDLVISVEARQAAPKASAPRGCPRLPRRSSGPVPAVRAGVRGLRM